MDEVKKKAIERMGDILDAMKVELYTITRSSNTHAEDKEVSETLLNLTYCLEYIYGIAKEDK